jgi:nucleotide-binding universal stress UspA family protein
MVAPQERRIVVGVDGSESSARALKWAAEQAQLTGAVLEVVTTWEWPTSYGWGVVIPEGWSPTDDAQKVFDQAVGPVAEAHPGVTIRPMIVEGHPAPVLVEESEGADLLVVGSRGHGEFAGMLLGSVSEHCVTNAHCPVLVFRDGQ